MNKPKGTNYLIMTMLFLLVILAGVNVYQSRSITATAQDLVFEEEDATIRAIKRVMPAVVTIIISDREDRYTTDETTGQTSRETEIIQGGTGTGFLISADGYIITNKHVLSSTNEKTAEYKIILNSGKEYYAQFIGKDPSKDMGILKIFDKDLPYVELGDSDDLEIGSTVIAIGNSLGRYKNSATKGIVSGLGRYLQAADQSGNTEVLDNVIQTDAEINVGNSGGPLIDLYGNVVGINTAVDKSGTAIGFAIPVNDARPIINSVRNEGRIIRPFLGVRYLMITPKIAYDNELTRTNGAWIYQGENGSPAVVEGSPAAKAGLMKDDIIFEINAIPVDEDSTLYEVIQKYKPGERIGMKVQRGDKVVILEAVLEEYK